MSRYHRSGRDVAARHSPTGTANLAEDLCRPIGCGKRRSRIGGDRDDRFVRTGRHRTGGVSVTGGHRVIRLVRRDPLKADERRWEPANPLPICLTEWTRRTSGRGVDRGPVHRFPRRADPGLRIDLRVGWPRSRAGGGGPRAFVSASAIGFYGYAATTPLLDEDSPRGDGFSLTVVADWRPLPLSADAGLRFGGENATGIVHVLGGRRDAKLLRPTVAAPRPRSRSARQRAAVAAPEIRHRQPARRCLPTPAARYRTPARRPGNCRRARTGAP